MKRPHQTIHMDSFLVKFSIPFIIIHVEIERETGNEQFMPTHIGFAIEVMFYQLIESFFCL